MSWEKEVQEIDRRRRLAVQLGGKEAVALQHERGRHTVRERIELLADPGSWRETGPIAGHAEIGPDGEPVAFRPANYVLGFARVDGRPCVVGGEDFTQKGGSPSPAGLRKSVYAEDLAIENRVPLIRLLEGGGGSVAGASGKTGRRLGDPVYSRPRFASFAEVMATAPVISVALGAVAGFPAARLAASHFSIMTRETSQVLIAGPAIVERALSQKHTKDELGGPEVHLRSGVVDVLAEDEPEALGIVRRFLSYLPTNVDELPPIIESDDDSERREEELLSIIPRNRKRVYDVRRLLELVFDRGSFVEIARGHGPSLVVGLVRLAGRPVGVFANDPCFFAGAMGAEAAQKMRRFVDVFDTFHLPIVSFVDEPGFMIGLESERAGTIRYGTAAIFAVNQSAVPWVSVHVRKAYGVAGAAHFGPGGEVLRWPSAESGAVPIEGGVAVAFRREIAAAPDPEARRRELEDQLGAAKSPFPAAEDFSVHDLIDPRETRPRLCEWVERVWPRLRRQLGSRSWTIRP